VIMADVAQLELVQETPFRWRIEQHGEMRVPGRVFASSALLPDIATDEALRQVANVATLPGIVEASYAMPDVHWGYGFPIGGVAATDVAAGGVLSPGGVGFDISCGVRLLVTQLSDRDIAPHLSALMDSLSRCIPRGMGKGAVWSLGSVDELVDVMRNGAAYAVAHGFGSDADLARCEDGGTMAGAEPHAVSERARSRGLLQVGSLGSGNHFLEVQAVDTIYDPAVAKRLGLFSGQICVMIHCGSRGLGHQICSDHVKAMGSAMVRYGISVPDRQLACVPVESVEGRSYLGAMAAAANYAQANRQVLAAAARKAFFDSIGTHEIDLLYDLSHNLAKIETHDIDGTPRQLCVHRKGATRALPPGHTDLPADLREVGQPVLVPGSMGTASYVLAGVQPGGAFFSACHGAGRALSRHQAKRKIRGADLRAQLENAGITVRASSVQGLAEEAPFAYKDVDEVVATCEVAGLARRIARLRPVGVVKG
jgi:tRNA-splicing ligase RtcB (3'-phosphate/5'-hydroxy nucleic acid ligase)